MYCSLMKVRSVSHYLPADFVRTKDYDTLSGVLLAVTGCEALFAKCDTFTPLILYPLMCLVALVNSTCFQFRSVLFVTKLNS
jgi:hypothetical protein